MQLDPGDLCSRARPGESLPKSLLEGPEGLNITTLGSILQSHRTPSQHRHYSALQRYSVPPLWYREPAGTENFGSQRLSGFLLSLGALLHQNSIKAAALT